MCHCFSRGVGRGVGWGGGGGLEHSSDRRVGGVEGQCLKHCVKLKTLGIYLNLTEAYLHILEILRSLFCSKISQNDHKDPPVITRPNGSVITK